LQHPPRSTLRLAEKSNARLGVSCRVEYLQGGMRSNYSKNPFSTHATHASQRPSIFDQPGDIGLIGFFRASSALATLVLAAMLSSVCVQIATGEFLQKLILDVILFTVQRP
jgi:hypothetical protein